MTSCVCNPQAAAWNSSGLESLRNFPLPFVSRSMRNRFLRAENRALVPLPMLSLQADHNHRKPQQSVSCSGRRLRPADCSHRGTGWPLPASLEATPTSRNTADLRALISPLPDPLDPLPGWLQQLPAPDCVGCRPSYRSRSRSWRGSGAASACACCRSNLSGPRQDR